eukprot:Seg6632.2 transcript_id=Seg6632.2/GoldUCD/mRNA.D3Y31 product="COMM domain-containing protein 6" protein_id=Seg6632.2/GoldUCD/D3Y31
MLSPAHVQNEDSKNETEAFKMVSKKDDPNGLQEAANLMNQVPNDILSDLCMNVLLFLQYKKAEVDTSRTQQLLQASQITTALTSVQRLVNALCYHYRNAVAGSMSNESFSENLQSTMVYKDDKIKVIVEAWELEGKYFLQKELNEHLSVGELISIDWKLNMAISSSSCKNLNAPSVTMLIKVSKPSGEITKRAFEMTLHQFQQFSKQLEQAKSVLETV